MSVTGCDAEMCPYWSGDGDVCPCAVFGFQRPVCVECDRQIVGAEGDLCAACREADYQDRMRVTAEWDYR
jgi:hypothetical protein